MSEGGVTGQGFRKGRSGNPGGRPKAAYDIQALARQHGPEAIHTLVGCLKDPKHKVAAAIALLDRGFGKATQPVSGDANGVPIAYSFRWADATTPPEPEPEAIDDASDADDVEVLFATPPC